MAQIKNFGLIGVGSDVQFGKGGARLVQTNGLFALRDAAGAFTRLQIADPSLGNDAVHKSYVDAGITAIQAELDLTQTSVGLGPNGSLPTLVGSYISASASIRSAVEALDAALVTERAARIAGDDALGLRIDGATAAIGQVFASFTAFETATTGSLTAIGSTLAAHGGRLTTLETRVTTAETEIVAAFGSFTAFQTSTNATLANHGTRIAALEVGNSGVQAELDLTQASIGLAPSGSYVAPAVSNYGAGSTSVLGFVSAIDTALFAVDGNLTAVEGAVGLGTNGSLAPFTGASHIALATNVRGALVALDAALVAENADRVADQAALQSEIDANEAAIAAESAARSAADTALGGRIDDETTARSAAVGSLNTAILAEQAARIAADGSLAANIGSIAAAYINKDGSVAFTGNQSMGGFRLTNVATPTALFDAVPKQYVDNLVGGLGNVFNYVGSVVGGTAGSPLDLAMLTENDPGDYYKVSASGWFQVGAGAPFFANANDGIVFNATGGADIIDNTDSAVFGSPNIAVTGSTDVGYTVDLSTSFLSRVSIIETDLNAVELDLADEITTRVAEIARVDGRITTLRTDFDGHVVAQTANNAAQQVQIDSNASAIAQEVVARASADNALGSLIAAESAARVAANGSLTTVISNLQATLLADIAGLDTRLDILEPIVTNHGTRITALETEVQNSNASLELRVAAAEGSIISLGTELRGSITAVETAAFASISALGTQLRGSITAVETAAAAALDAASLALSTAITDASSALSATITAVNGNLSVVETSVGLDTGGFIPAGAFTGSYVPSSAVDVIAAINGLGNGAGAADAVLRVAIVAEEIARQTADVALETELTETQNLIGLFGTLGGGAPTLVWGSTAPGYLSATDTVREGVEAVANALSNLSQDEIRSASGNTRVRAAAGQVEMFAPSGSGTFLAMTVEATGSADSAMALVATAGEVQMVAEGSPADINIRLIPKGTGQVFIGSVGATAGVVGAEAGEDLIVTGGNNSAGPAGDLILKGGDGTTDGIVEVQSGAGTPVARFTNEGPNRLDFTGGSLSLGLVAAGSGDLDIVLDPLGSGRVDVSNAVVTNVATPSAASDAANKGYVDTAVATSLTSAFAGAVRTRVVTLTNAGSVNLGAMVRGTVLRVRASVTNAFAAGSALRVGVSGSTEQLAAEAETDLQTTGLYLVENAMSYGSDTQVLAEVVGSGSGSVTVVLEYLQG